MISHSCKQIRLLCIVVSFFLSISVTVNHSIATSYHWNLQHVGIPQAWQYTTGASDVIVAIIDSGINFSHPDLIDTSWVNSGEIPNNGWDDDNNGYIDDYMGWDFQDNDKNPAPPRAPAEANIHGTFIAGLIAADNDNDLFVGVAPGVKLMSLRFLRDDLSFTYGDWDKLILAIDYAVDNGADIINLSLQAYGIPPTDVYEAIKRAYSSDVIIIGVTGNYENHVTYPGNYSEVIAVSATTSSQEIADFSAFGSQTEICAPGKDVYSINGDDTSIVTGSGTSFAAPLVSGAIALMLSMNISLTNDEIRNLLSISCVDLGEEGRDPFYGFGLLNISAVLSHITPDNRTHTTTTTSTNIPDPEPQFDLPIIIFSFAVLGGGILTIFIIKKKY